MANKNPFKLHVIVKRPDLIPFNAFFATSSASISRDDADMLLVNRGIIFLAATRIDNTNHEQHLPEIHKGMYMYMWSLF